ncbi:MAG: MFS transporter [Candidatus Thorarchaeota archaeon]
MVDENPNNKSETGISQTPVESIPERIDPIPEVPASDAPPESEQGFLASLRSVLSYGSYSVYLITSWILGVFGIIMQSYLMLFLRDYLNLYIPDITQVYITIGVIVLGFMSIELIARFFGGYIGDNFNRKWLSVLTMLVAGLAMLILAFSTDFLGLLVGSFIIAGSAIFGSGSTSYIYEQIEPKHSGLAMGLFQTSSGFGLIGLGLVTWLLALGTPFVITIQVMFFIGSMCYMGATVIRALFLKEPRPIKRENRNKNRTKDFLFQNSNALKLLYVILPVFVLVLILDAISDGFYRFVSMFYLNEALAFSIGEISLMLIVVLAFSIPLSITVGGFFDRRGSRRAILLVYSVMPFTLLLLILAPAFPYWLPIGIIAPLISSLPILEPLLSTAFIAIAMKNINDILWWTLILTYLRKAIPRSETAKMLSIFFIVTSLAFLITPIPSGFVYTYFGAIPVLFIALILNFGILAILVFGNIEPKSIPEEYRNL